MTVPGARFVSAVVYVVTADADRIESVYFGVFVNHYGDRIRLRGIFIGNRHGIAAGFRIVHGAQLTFFYRKFRAFGAVLEHVTPFERVSLSGKRGGIFRRGNGNPILFHLRSHFENLFRRRDDDGDIQFLIGNILIGNGHSYRARRFCGDKPRRIDFRHVRIIDRIPINDVYALIGGLYVDL